MIHINDNFLKLPESYLFSEIAHRVQAYRQENPKADIISLGIGDVTRPLAPAVTDALHKAVDEMSRAETFRGYGPEQGYRFLTDTIIAHDFTPRGVALDPDEVFIGDGAKSDLGNIGDLFARECRVAITDPVYPVYIDTNVMGGRAGEHLADGRWSDIIYLPCTSDNGFIPALPAASPDIIYLCYPNNPTGTTLSRAELKRWVDYALANEAVILFDAAYEAFIRDEDVPHSIYEIEGAKEVAIEFRSFSKTAGFTGLRCGYTVVPKALKAGASGTSLNGLWNRRQSTKFNGTAYIVQRAAEAIYTPEGRSQIVADIDYYMGNAAIIRQGLTKAGFEVYGGRNAPYIWMKTPDGIDSWSFFNRLLSQCQIVGTPGTGFGPHGEGFLRLTAFGTRENTIEAINRIVHL